MYEVVTWPMKVEHEAKFDRNEYASWMYSLNLKYSRKNMEVREILDWNQVSLPVKRNRLWWFVHVKQRWCRLAQVLYQYGD